MKLEYYNGFYFTPDKHKEGLTTVLISSPSPTLFHRILDIDGCHERNRWLQTIPQIRQNLRSQRKGKFLLSLKITFGQHYNRTSLYVL